MEGNVSVYQVNPVGRITGEGRAEFLRTWEPGFDQKGAGGGRRGRGGQLNLCVETKIFQGDKSDGFGKNAPACHWTGGGGGAGGAAQSVRGNCTSLKGINVTVLERTHQFIM